VGKLKKGAGGIRQIPPADEVFPTGGRTESCGTGPLQAPLLPTVGRDSPPPEPPEDAELGKSSEGLLTDVGRCQQMCLCTVAAWCLLDRPLRILACPPLHSSP